MNRDYIGLYRVVVKIRYPPTTYASAFLPSICLQVWADAFDFNEASLQAATACSPRSLIELDVVELVISLFRNLWAIIRYQYWYIWTNGFLSVCHLCVKYDVDSTF